MSNRIKVCIRTRPSQNFAQNNISIDSDCQHIQINLSNGTPVELTVLNNKSSVFKFQFDHIFHNASQEFLYDMHAHNITQSVIEGYNSAILTYGQTGKT